jgi:hypothetical protein
MKPSCDKNPKAAAKRRKKKKKKKASPRAGEPAAALIETSETPE